MSPDPGKDTARVVVCVCTCRRPTQLYGLLAALDAQRFEGEAPDIRIVVVDNDASGSAQPVCQEAAEWIRHPIEYRREPQPGIPSARNAAVSAAADADWIAFVDDDEMPEAGWLDALLCAQRRYGADVVSGPVRPRFEEPPPAWVLAGRFFDPPRRPAGLRLPAAYTHNALVKAACLAALDRMFDERMTPMGEDTELFGRLAVAGAVIIWAPDAVVYESVPRERTRTRWLVLRSFWTGVAAGRILRDRASVGDALKRVVVGWLWCLVRGGAETLLAPCLGRATAVHGLRRMAFASGRCVGYAGG